MESVYKRNISPEALTDMQERCDLYNNSPGNASERDGYFCPKCNNNGGFMYINDDNYEVFRPCPDCSPIRKMLRMARSSGLTQMSDKYRFKSFVCKSEWQKIAMNTVKQFCSDPEARALYIGGQTGCGKSHLCTAAVREFLKQGYSCKIINWRSDGARIKAIANDAEKYAERVNFLKSVKVLYIDDLFKCDSTARPTSADINLAYDIINHRVNQNGLITIISSEMSGGDLTATDRSIAGRIYEMTDGEKYFIEISKSADKNYRMQNRIGA